jgi:hypothetical protein
LVPGDVEVISLRTSTGRPDAARRGSAPPAGAGEVRALCGGAQDLQAAGVEMGLEVTKEVAGVVVGRILLEDAIRQAGEGAVVNQGEDTEQPVVQMNRCKA